MKKWIPGIVAFAILALVLPGAAVAQEPVACAHTYVVQPGDWLAKIAARTYDNPWAYPIIVFATNSAVPYGDGFQVISDPNLIEPGWKLCIPDAETAMGAVGVDTLKNIAYQSDWTKEGTAPLVDGEYSEPAAPGSATKTVVKLHDRMAFGYTADGQQLAAAVLVTDPGGSGTFYELAAIAFQDGKPQHVASALLGDRVQIQSLALQDGEIVVEMIAQGPNDPMCCPTQHVVERYVLQGEELAQVSSEVAADAPDIAGVVWEWERFVGGDGSATEVDDPSRYTLVLNADGTYQVRADCNRAGGGYTLDEAHLTLQPGPTTLAECEPGSLYDAFLARLGDVRTYVREDESDWLVLNLWADAGDMFFRPVKAVHLPEAAAMPLEGTSWKLASYHDGVSALASVLNGTEITAAFAGGKLTGSAGCNSYSASYEGEGDALTFGPAATTRKMCAEPQGIMEQEQAYLAALESVAGYRIQGGRLELLDTKGTPVATFVAA